MRGTESELRAVGELHLVHEENRAVVEDVEWTLGLLRDDLARRIVPARHAPAAVAGRVGA
ncbi:hypothetical protein ACFY4I_13655 [Streptomyces scabiei]|uniref:hypothetical protein n=1 Tax=Streptomyces scabiei TaxID=1930 RepID=UPI0036BF4C55